jgi:hypothetical protein
MKKLFLLLSICFLLFSCEAYVSPNSDVSLSGKYVVSKVDITNVDQNQTRDSLYLNGTTYNNPLLPKPFDNIQINRFYIHMDYSTIRMKQLGVTSTGQDIWKYGNHPNEIFYRILNNTAYSFGYLQFDYITDDGSSKRMTFYIEDDGYESLQLKSSGAWFNGKFGQKQVMTLTLTRVGP